jgi:hypothetical protein
MRPQWLQAAPAPQVHQQALVARQALSGGAQLGAQLSQPGAHPVVVVSNGQVHLQQGERGRGEGVVSIDGPECAVQALSLEEEGVDPLGGIHEMISCASKPAL